MTLDGFTAEELLGQVTHFYALYNRRTVDGIEAYIITGQHLAALKAQLGWGKWTAYVESNLPMSYVTANRMIYTFETFGVDGAQRVFDAGGIVAVNHATPDTPEDPSKSITVKELEDEPEPPAPMATPAEMEQELDRLEAENYDLRQERQAEAERGPTLSERRTDRIAQLELDLEAAKRANEELREELNVIREHYSDYPHKRAETFHRYRAEINALRARRDELMGEVNEWKRIARMRQKLTDELEGE